MQYRYAYRVDRDFPRGRYVDLASDQNADELRKRCIADVRDMMRTKIVAVHPPFGDPEELLLAMLRFAFLVDKRAAVALTDRETAWLDSARAWLARIWAIRQAADDIAAEIAAQPTAAALFDHSAALADNPIWPE
jgi:hypothetical protein